jgi:hypothetical protein
MAKYLLQKILWGTIFGGYKVAVGIFQNRDLMRALDDAPANVVRRDVLK